MNVCSAWRSRAWKPSAAGSNAPAINPITSQSEKTATGIYRAAVAAFSSIAFAVSASVALAAPAQASGWTPARAAAIVKANYRTPDVMQPDAPDALVAKATCAGVGKPADRGRFFRFNCSAVMRGWGEYASDGFHPTKKLTVGVSRAGHWSIREGWR